MLSDVPEDSRMATEEVFGPAVPLFIVKDLDEALSKLDLDLAGKVDPQCSCFQRFTKPRRRRCYRRPDPA